MAKLNTNSNVYTICYAAIMVALVAFLLAFVSSSLADKQKANEDIDKKSQILASLGVRGLEKSQVEPKYDELIKETFIMDKDGKKLDGDAFDVPLKEIFDGNKLPVYIATTPEGKKAYILPLKGRGLWGGLWGYIALDETRTTVVGAYFNHESETAGLGALIKEEPFQAQFQGRPVYGEEEGKVALTVVKKGQGAAEGTLVDGVTGATLTSKGVAAMVTEGLQKYADAFAASK